MANTLYDKARELFLTAQIDWTEGADTIKCVLVDTGTYTFNATHQWYSSVQPYIVGSPVTLTGKTTTSGAADANDCTFSAVSGASVEALVLYKDSGSGDGSSPLIAYIDTATGLPITPNGGDIIVTWDNGTNKIFRL